MLHCRDKIRILLADSSHVIRPKLHYTDTGYGHVVQHHQQHALAMPKRCGKFLSVGGDFVVQQVVELLCARPLMVSVAGVRVVEFGPNTATDQRL